MKAKVTFVNGMQFVGNSSTGHAVIMDGDKSVGGEDTAPRPMEMLLIAAGGCSGMDVIHVLRKKKQDVTGVEVNVAGQMAEDYPKKFTEISLEFIVKGRGIQEAAVERAVELSMTKYCSVKATLEGIAKFKYSYRIIQE